MTTPINTFQDILDALERDPTLRQALRAHILTEELIQLPALVHQLISDVDELKQGQTKLEADMAEVKTDMAEVKTDLAEVKTDLAEVKTDLAEVKTDLAGVKTEVASIRTELTTVGGHVSHLRGTDYQGTVARIAGRLARHHLGLLDPSVISQAGNNPTSPLEAVDHAISEGRISWEQAEDLDLADIVMSAITPSGEQRFVLAEVSITVQQKDMDTAAKRAHILTDTTGITTIPVAIGTTLEPGAESPETRFIPFNPAPRGNET